MPVIAAYVEQFPQNPPTLHEAAKRFRDAVAQVDFSKIPGVYDSIPWAEMDKALSLN
jgi:hypothetical protein